jgi:hypothetical protein
MIAITAIVVTILLPVAAITLLGQPADERDDGAFERSRPTLDDVAGDGASAPSADSSPTDDLVMASAAVVTEGDLPAGWRQCCPDLVYAPAELDEHICGSGAGLPPHTAGFQRQFALNPTLDGYEQGHIVHAVFIAPTDADAAREFEAVDTPEYGPCAETSVARSAQDSVPDATAVLDFGFERGTLPDGAPGIVDRFATTFQTPTGPRTVYTAFVRMQQGRAIVRMPITSYGAPMSDADLQPLVAAATEALRGALD